MNNILFDLFVNQKSAKEIWNTLETRYGGDDAGRKNYVVGKWLQFHMADNKPIMDQVHEYGNLVADVSEYRNHLKHKKQDLNLQELIFHMRTEEANHLKDKEISNSSIFFKANLVESSTSSKDRLQPKGNKFQKGRQQKTFKGNDGKIQKNKVSCYCCGKLGHKAYQCFQMKDQQKTSHKPPSQSRPQINLTEQEEVIAAVIVKANLMENKTDWILDTGASKQFYSNKELFQDFEEARDGECVFMGNSTTAGVMAIYDLIIHQMDVKTTFLNGDLKEEIYMEQSKGFAFPGQEDKVLINETKRFLSSQFEMKDLGEADVILGQEAEWLRNLVGDMSIWGSSIPVSIYCDFQGAIGIVKNFAYNGIRRHIRIRHGTVKELFKNGIISLEYVRSERNLTDPLTKGLTRRIIL
ncbi:UNVERIFIED_CONTAM: hypothetical protein Scaly_2765200 [Sesamum calycinum]|uniref:CCHC-type domain-containing protein n=1 Tax=Sesamum calycinum TaxID=2727403 RepID=A0AAW2J143_9LAMI